MILCLGIASGLGCGDDELAPDASVDAETLVDATSDIAISDAELQDSELPDGEVQDGEVPDGEVPDGEVPDVVVMIPDAATNPPTIPSTRPVIHLADNLDEADGAGWCIDTVGRGLGNQLHAHSCKPSPDDEDVRYRYDAASGHIRAVVYDGLCAELVDLSDPSRPLGLLDCDATKEAQRFEYSAATGEFTLGADPSMCIAVGRSSRQAGRYMARDLTVEACASVDPSFKTWVILD